MMGLIRNLSWLFLRKILYRAQFLNQEKKKDKFNKKCLAILDSTDSEHSNIQKKSSCFITQENAENANIWHILNILTAVLKERVPTEFI